MEGFESLNEERVQNFNLKMSVPRKRYDSLDLCIPWTQLFMHTRGTVLQWLSLLHSFIQLSLNSGSAQVQTLLVACRRFAMVRIPGNGLGWK